MTESNSGGKPQRRTSTVKLDDGSMDIIDADTGEVLCNSLEWSVEPVDIKLLPFPRHPLDDGIENPT